MAGLVKREASQHRVASITRFKRSCPSTRLLLERHRGGVKSLSRQAECSTSTCDVHGDSSHEIVELFCRSATPFCLGLWQAEPKPALNSNIAGRVRREVKQVGSHVDRLPEKRCDTVSRGGV